MYGDVVESAKIYFHYKWAFITQNELNTFFDTLPNIKLRHNYSFVL